MRRLETRPSVSVITVAELYAGVRNESEHRRIEALPALLHVRDVDFEIARLAGRYRLQYRTSHGVGIPDALIAATAQVHGARLVTRNRMQAERATERFNDLFVGVDQVDPEELVALAQRGDLLGVDPGEDVHGVRRWQPS